jgi:hypothetical protein
MAERKTIWIAWALFGVVALSSAAAALAMLLQRAPATPLLRFVNDLSFSLVTPLLFAGVGALILSRLPGHRIGWLIMTPALAIGVYGLLDAYLQPLAAAPPKPTPLLLLLVWVTGWSWVWLVFPLLLIAQLFPSGRALSPRWRALARATLGWAGLFVALVTLSRTYTTIDTTPALMLENPFGIFDLQWLDAIVGAVWIPGLLILTGLSATTVVLRYRRASLVEREQIAWLLYARCSPSSISAAASSAWRASPARPAMCTTCCSRSPCWHSRPRSARRSYATGCSISRSSSGGRWSTPR